MREVPPGPLAPSVTIDYPEEQALLQPLPPPAVTPFPFQIIDRVRRTRHFAFVLGLGLHLTIILTTGAVWQLSIFAALMFALYLLFLDAEPRSRLVIWDEQCCFCTVWIRWFTRLDWLHVHRFVGSSEPSVLARAGIDRAEADAAIQLVGPEGRRAAGFGAIRSILESQTRGRRRGGGVGSAGVARPVAD